MNDVPPTDAVARAERLRLVCFDVDGTLTDGRLHYDADGRESKSFYVQDGLGLKLLREHGIEVALVTARHSPIVSRRGAELGLTHVYQGCADKRAELIRLCHALGIGAEQTGFMGDDLPDLAAMGICGLAAAPADANPVVQVRVHWQSRFGGGRGAAREFCDFVLAAQGLSQAVLTRYLG